MSDNPQPDHYTPPSPHQENKTTGKKNTPSKKPSNPYKSKILDLPLREAWEIKTGDALPKKELKRNSGPKPNWYTPPIDPRSNQIDGRPGDRQPVASILPWDEEMFYDIAYGRHPGSNDWMYKYKKDGKGSDEGDEKK